MPGSTTLLKNMVELPGGSFRMGCEDFYPEERPVREVSVDGFRIDRHPVTVAEFRRFVKETGHVTWAEQAPDPADYPGADPALLVPGSLVFHRSQGPVDLRNYANWWSWMPGADWRHPEGPASNVGGASSTRSRTSPTRTPPPTPTGRASRFRARPSGSTPRAAGSTGRPTRGATSSRRAAG